MKHKGKVYISLPISGRPIEEAKAEAEAARTKLSNLGYDAITPFDVVAEPQGNTEKEKYAYCMGRDIEELLKCDAIYLVDGHEESRGCELEFMAAVIYGLKIL